MSVLLAGDFKASEASPSAPGAHVQPATTATNADSWHFLVNNDDHRRMYDDKKTYTVNIMKNISCSQKTSCHLEWNYNWLSPFLIVPIYLY